MESKCWCVFRRRSCATLCVSTVALKCSSFQPACATSDRDSTFSALQHNKNGAPQPQTLTETRRCCVTLGENQPCDILLTSILFYQAAAAVAAARRRHGGGSSQVIVDMSTAPRWVGTILSSKASLIASFTSSMVNAIELTRNLIDKLVF